MRVGQAAGDAVDDAKLFRQRHAALAEEALGQILPFQKLLHDEGEALVGLVVVEDAHDVGVVQAPRRSGLAGEALPHGFLVGLAGLHGDLAADQRIPGLIDVPEAPGSDARDDLVPAEGLAFLKLPPGLGHHRHRRGWNITIPLLARTKPVRGHASIGTRIAPAPAEGAPE